MNVVTESLALPVDDVVDAVSAVVHRPTRPTRPAVLLTHGAGGSLDTPGLVALCDAIAGAGHLVVRANLPYREAGRRAAPRADRSVAGFRAIFEQAHALAPRTPWIVGGKSYGGRVASLAVAEGLAACGLLFYGYPLHPPGKPERLRVDHWPDIAVPCLFLQGTRDTFCDLALLQQNLRRLPRRARLEVIEGGDHSLKIARSAAPDGKAVSSMKVVAGLASLIDEWATDACAGD